MSITVEKCLQAWTNSLRQMNAKADIVFFGDSLTYYGDFASVFPDKIVCNLGLRGDTIQNMIDRVEQVRILEPRRMFLMAGINDVSSCSLEHFEEQYEVLIIKLLNIYPKTEVIIQSLLPVNNKDYQISCTNEQIVGCNKLISSLASEYKLPYLDLFSLYVNNDIMPSNMTIDGLHLQKEAYNKWYGVLNNFKQQNNNETKEKATVVRRKKMHPA